METALTGHLYKNDQRSLDGVSALYSHNQESRERKVRALYAASLLSVFAAVGGAGVACNPSVHAEIAVTRSDCVRCHMPEYEAAKQPLHIGNFPTTCASCHSETMWAPAQSFDHARFFALGGAHSLVACGQCHTRGYKRGDTPTDCVGCHRKDYDASPFPNHNTFPTTCADCHTPSGWKPASLPDHDQFFPLQGKHAAVSCASCHTQGYAPGATPKDCVSCHRKDYDASPFPNHNTFATTCADCHTPSGWKPASLPDHDQFFPLQGKHAAVSCASCHTQGYAPGATPKDCVSCHRRDYDASPFPNHSTFSTNCSQCHTTVGWKPATIPDHDNFFPLDGKHVGVACASCHTQGYAAGATPKECVGCHKQDYDNSPYPGHASFPTTCRDCHMTSGWTPASGGHPESKFPITMGKHDNIACGDCHNSSLGPNGKGNADCVGCHTGEHSRSRMDAEHKGERNYPTGAAAPNFCLSCHATGRGD